jgi:beta-glucanase (GH16 family)
MKRFLHLALTCTIAVVACAACGEEPAFHPQKVAALAAKSKRSESATAKTPFGQKAADYVLTFNEEFDSFNAAVWNDHIWYEKPNPTKNFTVEKGVLKIWPQRDASGKFFNRTLDTDGKFEQKYGYFEMEAKLPRGKGTWPAFWLFAHPGNRRPEIDIMEAYPGGIDPWGYTDDAGISRPTAYGATVWLDEGVSAGTRQYDARTDLSAKFHKYAAKWEPGRVTFYLDGKQTYFVEANMTDPMYIIVDLWFGSSSGEPDETTPIGKANSFEVNYIRAWQFRNHEQGR